MRSWKYPLCFALRSLDNRLYSARFYRISADVWRLRYWLTKKERREMWDGRQGKIEKYETILKEVLADQKSS